MKKVLTIICVCIITFLCLVLLIGCTIDVPGVIIGSGKAETRDFNLTGFSDVQAAAAFTVHIERADSYKVQITTDDNLWENLDIKVYGDTLTLDTKPGINIRNTKLNAVITMPLLNKINISGATRAGANGFVSGGSLNVTVSGASVLVLENIEAGSTVFNISGSGRISGNINITDGEFTVSGGSTVDLSGIGTSASMNASGGSRITLNQFELREMSIILSGGSTARINTQNINSADVTGGSRLYYVGNPTLGTVNVSGGSTINTE